MRAIEGAAIASGQVTGRALMARAGAAVVGAVRGQWPELWPELSSGARRAVVLCGPGNNGGDGYVIARLLAEAGWKVQVLACPPGAASPDAAALHAEWAARHPIAPVTLAALRATAGADVYADLYVDALFGTGLSRAPVDEVGTVLEHMARHRAEFAPRTVAVDAPSGLNLDTGRSLMGGDRQPSAALTVTFDSPKRGHHLAEGPATSGRLVVADIGLGPWRDAGLGAGLGAGLAAGRNDHRLGLVTVAPPTAQAPHPGQIAADRLAKGGGHKYGHGHAVVVGGGTGRAGAARLSAQAALRVGAGLVTLALPPDAVANAAARACALMIRPAAGARDVAAFLSDARLTGLCIGPGLGLGAAQAARVGAVLDARRPTVLDADALTHLSRDPALGARLHPGCVLTPHGGEFARLFPDLDTTCRVTATRTAAARMGCTVLLKGPDTVVAAPDGTAAVHSAAYDRAAPWLATAGSGDVLAGLITGLLARGFAPFDAACASAWLHVEAALRFGPGLIADDLPDQIPAVFRALHL